MPEISGHNCGAPVSVVLHEVEETLPDQLDVGQPEGDIYLGLPVIDNGIDFHEWKDGPTSITRRAEVDFPLSGLGTDWYRFIKAYQEEGGWQRATILMTPSDDTLNPSTTGTDPGDLTVEVLDSGEILFEDPNMIERPVMTGYIGAVGANGTNTGHLTIYGPYQLLRSIPVGETIDHSDDLRSIFEWFTSEFVSGQEVYESLDYEINGLDAVRENLADKYSAGSIDEIGFITSSNFAKFSTNRDTLADVAKYIRESLGFELRFEVQDDWSLKLVANLVEAEELFDPNVPDRIVEQRTFSEFVEVVNAQLAARTRYDATADGTLSLIENRALYEMKPYNTLILKGAAAPQTVRTGESTVITDAKGFYAEAKATHPELVERAGGELPLIRESELEAPADLERAARAQLKELLSDVSGGTMLLPLAPFINPGDELVAQPACNSMFDADLPDLTYEIERAVHTVSPNPENNTGTDIPRTDLSVTMATNPAAIETTSTMKDLKPSEGGDVKPKEYTLQGINFNAI